MKKISALLCTLLTLSTFAKSDEKLYLKYHSGLNYIQKQKFSKIDYSGTSKLKREFPVVGFGIGYEVEDSWRADVIFDYYFLFSQVEESRLEDGKAKIHLETKISTLMANLYKTFYINESFSGFLGCGAGLSFIGDEASGSFHQDREILALELEQGKKKFNLSGKLSAGIDYKLKENINLEMSYNYYYLGSNKPATFKLIDITRKSHFEIHNINLGIRIKL